MLTTDSYRYLKYNIEHLIYEMSYYDKSVLNHVSYIDYIAFAIGPFLVSLLLAVCFQLSFLEGASSANGGQQPLRPVATSGSAALVERCLLWSMASIGNREYVDTNRMY